MKFPYGTQYPSFWRYVDEVDGRDLDLSYPVQVIKAVKRAYFDKGEEYFLNNNEYTVFIPHPQRTVPYEVTLKPNICKGLKAFFHNHSFIVSGKSCPTSTRLAEVFMEQDKFFAMMVELKRLLPAIVHSIKLGNYKYAAINLASLTETFNSEIIELINQYFDWHPFFVDDEDVPGRKKYVKYLIVNHRSYIMSRDAYIAILIYRYDHGDYKYPPDKETDLPNHLKLLYENYNVLQNVDKLHRVKPSGSFLQDCRNIMQMKKELFFNINGLIEFHDLMEYGYYSDKILSIEVIGEINKIFKQESWLKDFFLILSLYASKFVEVKESDSKELVDTSKLHNYDLFVQAIQYLDSIYDSLLVKEGK